MEEVELHWPRLQQRMQVLMRPEEMSSYERVCLADLTPAHLAPLAQLYPPTASLPWWDSASNICIRFRASMHAFACRMHSAICATDGAYASAVAAFRDETTCPTELEGLVHDRFFPHVPPVLDESRLFHRLLRYWIYYYRHVDATFIDPQLRSFIDVHSDDDGEWTDGGSWRQR